MPYIENARRCILNGERIDQVTDEIDSPGELVYVLYRIANDYSEQRTPRFMSYLEAWGGLKIAAAELYRRKVAPYEDEKIEENGDI